MSQKRAKLINRYLKKIGAVGMGYKVETPQCTYFHSLAKMTKALYHGSNYKLKTDLAIKMSNTVKDVPQFAETVVR